MWPYSWTHVGTPSDLGHMDRVAATMPSQAHAGAAQEAPNIGQWEGQDVPLVRPSSCTVKGGIPSSRRYLPTYLMPGCGASGVGRSPPPDRLLLGRAAGSRYPLAVGAGGLPVGTRHQPRSSRSCELGLQAVGAALGRLGGGVSCMGVESLGWGAHPRPTARPWGVRAVPATHWLWMRGVWAWGPVTNPSARALASWLCALWGRHKGARGGGGASCLGAGRPGLGALARPTARPWCVRPGSATHWLWVRGSWA